MVVIPVSSSTVCVGQCCRPGVLSIICYRMRPCTKLSIKDVFKELLIPRAEGTNSGLSVATDGGEQAWGWGVGRSLGVMRQLAGTPRGISSQSCRVMEKSWKFNRFDQIGVVIH